MLRTKTPTPTGKKRNGFSMVELLISMAVMTEIMVVAYFMFDVNSRIGRTQVQIADLQQNQRVGQHDLIRLIRMSGRGSLPQLAGLVVDNNVAASTTITSDAGAPTAVEGTDIVTVRGVFTSPIFQIPQSGAASNLVLTPNADDPDTGSVTIRDVTDIGIPQSLEVFEELNGRTEAMVLLNARDGDEYAFVEITNVVVGTGTGTVRVDFKIKGNVYEGLTPAGVATWPANMTNVSEVGVVEEYRYYIRQDDLFPCDPATDPRCEQTFRLSRARVDPGRDLVWGGDLANASLDVADNILDLQVALGIDRNGNDTIDEDDTDKAADEWRYNDSGDSGIPDAAWDANRLFYVRVNTLARTDRPDHNYQSEPLTTIEDRDYSEPVTPVGTSERHERRFRRRILQTVVDLRNLG